MRENLRVLYEDNHCIAVYKPAGTLVQADSRGEPSLMDAVKTYLKKHYGKPGNVFLGLVHRLDRPVAGIVVFAKTSKGAARLSEQFRNHTIQKTYTALVCGVPEKKEATLIHYLYKNSDTFTAEIVAEDHTDAKRAELSYRTIDAKNESALLEIDLKTGRFHQIRAQLSAIGHSVVGDTKYGAPASLPDGTIALAATKLSFEAPTSKESVTLSIPPPFSQQKTA